MERPKKKSPACAGLSSLRVGGQSREVQSETLEFVQAPRRSAVQVPEHSPLAAVHTPEPSVADILTLPEALWLPRATVTVTAPLSPTLPVTVKEAEPA